ncbi:hypothetical protein [Rhizobium sp. HT1-10]|uniref:hypothetical protein n=1 Tax=Rhizobium sp. HT1-10 TaxID=3111638 RepID=UPI003C15434F
MVLAVEKTNNLPKEVFRMLEKERMASIKIENELSIPGILSHEKAVLRGNHHVVVPICDQNWQSELAKSKASSTCT